MDVDLWGSSGPLCTITLPVIWRRFDGTNMVTTHQLVPMAGKDALCTFVSSIIRDHVATVLLRNGHAMMDALGPGPGDVVFDKDIVFPGMRGPKVTVQTATMTVLLPGTEMMVNCEVEIEFLVENPSPLVVKLGTCAFEIQTNEGELLAKQHGVFDILLDRFEPTLRGPVFREVAARLAADMKRAERDGKGGKMGPAPGARLVGRTCGVPGCDGIVRSINVPLGDVDRLFCVLGVKAPDEEPPDQDDTLERVKNEILDVLCRLD